MSTARKSEKRREANRKLPLETKDPGPSRSFSYDEDLAVLEGWREPSWTGKIPEGFQLAVFCLTKRKVFETLDLYTRAEINGPIIVRCPFCRRMHEVLSHGEAIKHGLYRNGELVKLPVYEVRA